VHLPSRQLIAFAFFAWSTTAIAEGFNIQAADGAQSGLTFFFEGPESSSLGLGPQDPLRIGGGEQDFSFTFQGQGNALLGALLGRQYAVEAFVLGSANFLTFEGQENGFVDTRLGLSVIGDGNAFEFYQPPESAEVREVTAQVEVIGGANTLSLSSSDDGTYDWRILGADHEVTLDQTETRDTAFALFWAGEQNLGNFSFNETREIAAEMLLEGIRNEVTLALSQSSVGSLSLSILGADSRVNLSTQNSHGFTYGIDLIGDRNLIKLQAMEVSDHNAQLLLRGDDNRIDILQKQLEGGRLTIDIEGSGNALSILQSSEHQGP
jgi:hypothetical protein